MRILIVGCGSIGRRHAKNALAFAETAFVDEDVQVASHLGMELDSEVFSDLDSALRWKPGGVVVATPTHTHISVAQACVEGGAHVLIEKPISHSLDQVDTFLERAEQLGRKVFVVCNMRFHPAISTVRKNLKRIGRAYFARAHYGNYLPDMRLNVDYREIYSAKRECGGGVILDGVHELDYLVWLFGPVKEVLCHAGKLSNLEIETEDYASMLLTHEDGVRSEIHLDYLRTFKRRGCEIVGDEGMILWQSEGKAPEKCHVRIYEKKGRRWRSLLKTEDLDSNEPYRVLMVNFIQGISGYDVPLLTGREALGELKIALKALQMSLSNENR